MHTITNEILVTGASGFLAKHIILLLLEKGYRVRGTLRSMSREATLRATLSRYHPVEGNIHLVPADLSLDDGWDAAVAGCDAVMHVASPFPAHAPAHEDDLILPAKQGTLRVLRAASRAGVQRVVLTSSTAAISAGYRERTRSFNNEDWSNPDGEIGAYQKSKTLAERAAWEFVRNLPEEHQLELAVINPGYILGPVLDDSPATSNELLGKMMRGEVPGNANMTFNMVDVRDVARAHLAAMLVPEAAGKRFICIADTLWMREIAAILGKHFAPKGYRIPSMNLPTGLVKLFALFDKTARNNLSSLDREYSYDTSQTRSVLDWQPRPIEKTLVDMGNSLIEQGIV